MKKKINFAISFLILLYSCQNSSKTETVAYTKQDLKKIGWIEGNWKGMDGNSPFYEIYKFVNDSTIESISYKWDGKDSSQSSKSFLEWKESKYYLGDMMNWKVSQISDSSINMIPNFKAQNDIMWKFINQNSWDAILNSKEGNKIYHMERINHFAKKEN